MLSTILTIIGICIAAAAGRQGQPIVGTVEYTLSSEAPYTPMFWANVDEPSAS